MIGVFDSGFGGLTILKQFINVKTSENHNEGAETFPRLQIQHQHQHYGRIGVIGTKATIESWVYEIEINKLKKGIEIYSYACPLLVPLIEEGWIKKAETKMILKKYLRPLKEKRIDTLILGCTHYPFLIDDIKEIMGKNCQVLDSPKIVAEKLKDYLNRHPKIESKLSKNKKRIYYTTDDPQKFKRFSREFFGEGVEGVERVGLS